MAKGKKLKSHKALQSLGRKDPINKIMNQNKLLSRVEEDKGPYLSEKYEYGLSDW